MRRFPFAAPAVAIAIAATSPLQAESGIDRAIKQLSALTPDIVAARVTLKNDDLEARAMLTTLPVYQEKHGLLGIVHSDVFLRAFIDKRTGQVDWQVYSVVMYTAPAWQFYSWATYQTSQGVSEVAVQPVDRTVQDCTSLGGCSYIEQVTFPLTDDLARALARLYVAGKPPAIWRFRLKGQGGGDYNDGIAAAEVAGLVQRVDAWRVAHPPGLPPAGPTPGNLSTVLPTSSPRPLGITFVATPFGASLLTVISGGRAAEAGLSPGLFITAVNGKALAGLSLGDMQRLLTDPGQKTLMVSGKGVLIVP